VCCNCDVRCKARRGGLVSKKPASLLLLGDWADKPLPLRLSQSSAIYCVPSAVLASREKQADGRMRDQSQPKEKIGHPCLGRPCGTCLPLSKSDSWVHLSSVRSRSLNVQILVEITLDDLAPHLF
jgi:hypothetical protein